MDTSCAIMNSCESGMDLTYTKFIIYTSKLDGIHASQSFSKLNAHTHNHANIHPHKDTENIMKLQY